MTSFEETGSVGSPPTVLIESTVEDSQIPQHRVGLDAWCWYAKADAKDAALMSGITRWTHADPDMPLTRLMGRLHRQEQERGS